MYFRLCIALIVLMDYVNVNASYQLLVSFRKITESRCEQIETWTDVREVPNCDYMPNIFCWKKKKLYEPRERRTEICCSGYNLLNGICSPECTEFCRNSQCTAPNVCTCNPGFKKQSTYTLK